MSLIFSGASLNITSLLPKSGGASVQTPTLSEADPIVLPIRERFVTSHGVTNPAPRTGLASRARGIIQRAGRRVRTSVLTGAAPLELHAGCLNRTFCPEC